MKIYPYSTEGIGEDIIPKNVDFSLIDFFEKLMTKMQLFILENWLWMREYLLETHVELQ